MVSRGAWEADVGRRKIKSASDVTCGSS